MAPKKDTAPISVRPDALSGEKCIITGEIEGMKRKEAEQILINAGATIEKSLNKKVTLVVLGADAGSSKLEKIEKLGIETKDWDDVLEEIQGEGDAAAADEDDEGEEQDDDDEEGEEDEEEPEEKPKPTKKAAPKTKANSKAKADPVPAPAPAKPTPSSSSDDFLSGKHVIITGTITGTDRKEAASILEKQGAIVEKSLNKKVQLAILGLKPGPDKLSKIEELGAETISWAEVAQKLRLEVAPEKKVANVESGEAPDSVDGKTLLITGEIEGITRKAAQDALEAEGAKFAKSLNKSVELVVLGANAGPDKLNKIAAQGIPTVEWTDLVEKLGIDVEAPPKKKARKN